MYLGRIEEKEGEGERKKERKKERKGEEKVGLLKKKVAHLIQKRWNI